ncbi:MBL fold metallo-hydrolase [Actinoplanes sp. NPDC048967]|uniref:MBL fold metallo-hydrolase n=1 Tax=Actinoplanes sp. NPDC048967 TaxID=3155269 RepID=UPI0033DD6A02
MREVVDGVFEVGIGYVNVHLVVTDDGVVLVDTGLPRRSVKIAQVLHGMRRAIGDVHTVLLTHHHPDHSGGLAEVRRRSGARIVAHQADVPYVTGAERAVYSHPLLKLSSLLMGTPEPAPVDDVVTTDGYSPLPGFTAVHTPGHTAGHLSFLLDRSGGILFAGDAAAGKRGGRVGRTPKMVTADLDEQARSVAKLAGLEFEHAVFGHGRAISGRAVDRFREFAAV